MAEAVVKAGTSFDKNDMLCIFCVELPVKEVYQCSEGHILCSICYYKRVKKCPKCRVALPVIGIRARAIEKILRDVPYKCPNHKTGCKVTVKRHDLEEHMKLCPFKPVKVCQALGIKNCNFGTESGGSLFEHLKVKHKVKVLTSDTNIIQFEDFMDDKESLKSVYLYNKNTKGGQTEFMIYKELRPASDSKGEVIILCSHLGDTSTSTYDLEDHQFTCKFSFNNGMQKMSWDTTGPIVHYRNIASAIDGKFPESGFQIPLRYMKMLAQKAGNTQQGNNVEFNIRNVICQRR